LHYAKIAAWIEVQFGLDTPGGGKECCVRWIPDLRVVRGGGREWEMFPVVP